MDCREGGSQRRQPCIRGMEIHLQSEVGEGSPRARGQGGDSTNGSGKTLGTEES